MAHELCERIKNKNHNKMKTVDPLKGNVSSEGLWAPLSPTYIMNSILINLLVNKERIMVKCARINIF